MIAGPTDIHKKKHLTGTSSKAIAENSVLSNHHGISMKNPEEVTGNARLMLLKILNHLTKLLDLASSVVDNLNGKSHEQTTQFPLEIKRESSVLSTQKSPIASINTMERYQARLGNITMVDPQKEIAGQK
jgi:hypothetical protein